MTSRLSRIAIRGSLAIALAAPLGLIPLQEADAQPTRRGGQAGQDGQRGEGRGARGDRGDRGGRGGFMAGRGGQQPGGRGGQQAGRGGQQGGWGGGMFGGSMRSGWERRDLVILDRELDLDEAQESIIEVLLADYLDAFRDEGERIRDEMQASRPEANIDQETRDRFNQMRTEAREIREKMRSASEGDEETRERMSAELQSRIAAIREQAAAMRPTDEQRAEQTLAVSSLLDEWNRLRRQLDAAFRAEMSLILTEKQLEMLPDVEIDIRRARFIPSGRIAGESIDLTQLSRIAGIDTEVDGVLESVWPQYEVELDRALVARDLHTSEMGIVMMDAFRTRDATMAIESSKQEARLRSTVRDINLRYHDLASAVLDEAGIDEATIAAFDQSFREAVYRRIYSPTLAQRSFSAALELEDLSADVAAIVIEMESSYAAEVAGLNQLLEIETLQADPARISDRIERFAARFQGDQTERPRPDERLNELFTQRQDADDRFRKQLESLLTPDQVAYLPETREQRQERQRAEREALMANLVERFDTDGNGQINGAEWAEAGPAMREARQAAGENADGGRGGRGGQNAEGGRGGRGGQNAGGGRGGRGGQNAGGGRGGRGG